MIAIADIYDAAFDRDRFPALIERLVNAFGAQAGFLAWSDLSRDSGVHAEYGNDLRWLNSYRETYCRHDILLPVLQALPEGACTPAWPHLQTSAVRESLFYREYLAPQEIVDNLAVNLIKRDGMVANLSLLRKGPDAAPFTTDDCEALAKLVQHLQRAIFIQSHLARASDHLAGVRALEGNEGGGLMLLDVERSLVDADQALRASLGDKWSDRALTMAIDDAIDSGEPVSVELPMAEGGQMLRLLLQARQLAPSRFGDLAAGPAPAHAVHVSFIDQPRAIAFEAIASLFRLTPTELRVLRDAMHHGDLAGIGDRLGMAQATARTHLHRIYEKTGTGSFAKLSNLAHRFARIAEPR